MEQVEKSDETFLFYVFAAQNETFCIYVGSNGTHLVETYNDKNGTVTTSQSKFLATSLLQRAYTSKLTDFSKSLEVLSFLESIYQNANDQQQRPLFKLLPIYTDKGNTSSMTEVF